MGWQGSPESTLPGRRELQHQLHHLGKPLPWEWFTPSTTTKTATRVTGTAYSQTQRLGQPSLRMRALTPAQRTVILIRWKQRQQGGRCPPPSPARPVTGPCADLSRVYGPAPQVRDRRQTHRFPASRRLRHVCPPDCSNPPDRGRRGRRGRLPATVHEQTGAGHTDRCRRRALRTSSHVSEARSPLPQCHFHVCDRPSRRTNRSGVADLRAALAPGPATVRILARELAEHDPQPRDGPPGLRRPEAVAWARDGRHHVRRLRRPADGPARRPRLLGRRCVGRGSAAVLHRGQGDDGAV